MDSGDIELLSQYFAFNVHQNFNGDIMEYNFSNIFDKIYMYLILLTNFIC